MIVFNVPPFTDDENEWLQKAVAAHKICGDGEFTKKCTKLLEEKFGVRKVLLTTSGSTALDMAFLLSDLKKDDEVILPSFTFSSTANSVVLAGAKLVFTDIRPDTMNLDENKIEAAITDKTKAICVMHYAGVSCEMDKIIEIAGRYGLRVIEDAAQGVMSTYHGRALGTFGTFGCWSFHETKNYSMGEGGALLINDPAYIEQAEILREKGTNRSKFLRGQIDKYTWVGFGSSYLPSELNVAYIYPQFLQADEINEDRLRSWNLYYKLLKPLSELGKIDLPFIPEGCVHNGHMFYIKAKDIEERNALIAFLKEKGVMAVFHYIPLHSAPAGLKFGRFFGEDEFTTKESERLLRLPLYYRLTEEDLRTVVNAVYSFYREKCDI